MRLAESRALELADLFYNFIMDKVDQDVTIVTNAKRFSVEMIGHPGTHILKPSLKEKDNLE